MLDDLIRNLNQLVASLTFEFEMDEWDPGLRTCPSLGLVLRRQSSSGRAVIALVQVDWDGDVEYDNEDGYMQGSKAKRTLGMIGTESRQRLLGSPGEREIGGDEYEDEQEQQRIEKYRRRRFWGCCSLLERFPLLLCRERRQQEGWVKTAAKSKSYRGSNGIFEVEQPKWDVEAKVEELVLDSNRWIVQ
jgi:hypothetical protein